MNFEEVLTRTKEWQRQMGQWQDVYGKIDKEKVKGYYITNSPKDKEVVEFVLSHYTPMTVSDKGHGYLWHYVSQYTWIQTGDIDMNNRDAQLVIVFNRQFA